MLERTFGSRARTFALGLAVAAATLTACDGGDSEDAEAPTGGQSVDVPAAPESAQAPAPGPEVAAPAPETETAATEPEAVPPSPAPEVAAPAPETEVATPAPEAVPLMPEAGPGPKTETAAPAPEAAPPLDGTPLFGTDDDLLFADQIWGLLDGPAVTGPDAVRSEPYQGSLPHGEILEILSTRAEINGQEGVLLIKWNYLGDGITAEMVDSDPDAYLDAVTVMFQREVGYDPESGDWFWTKFGADGSIPRNPAGTYLAGRVAKGMDSGCIACHAGAPGGDYVFTELPEDILIARAPVPTPTPAPTPTPESTPEPAPEPAPEIADGEPVPEAGPPFGRDEDLGYAEQVWAMLDTASTAPGASVSDPYQGGMPHGEILTIVDTSATIGGHTGRLIIKNNFLGDGITSEQVAADPGTYLDSVTVMFKRAAGYDPEDGDWFWAKYATDGAVMTNPAGIALAGRVAKGADAGCIACHAGAPGGDFVFLERPSLVAETPPPEPASEPAPEVAAPEAPLSEAPAPEAPALEASPPPGPTPAPPPETALRKGPPRAGEGYDYRGVATPYDGHTLEFRQNGGAVIVTLWGLTGPALDHWPWGPWSRTYLEALLRGEEIGCRRAEGDGALYTRCYILSDPGAPELNALLVAAGFAVEDRQMSGGAYSAFETQARNGRLNLWRNWQP
ncbi:MAG: hypothetical protein O7A03_02455 [Alphaproteobacteria bacterium]|nr:hypothetical protein [Alphaproteobacteria bacterium]